MLEAAGGVDSASSRSSTKKATKIFIPATQKNKQECITINIPWAFDSLSLISNFDYI